MKRSRRGYSLLSLMVATIMLLLPDAPAVSAENSGEQRVGNTVFLLGAGPFAHESELAYFTGGGQATCKPGNGWAFRVIWHVKNVTKTSAYVEKLEVLYEAGIAGKNVALGALILHRGNGQIVWDRRGSDIGDSYAFMRGGSSLRQTHIINKTVNFDGRSIEFERRANVGGVGGEALWCSGNVRMFQRAKPGNTTCNKPECRAKASFDGPARRPRCSAGSHGPECAD